jgi:hypothetical protein
MMDDTDFCRMRRFLGLSQLDVSLAAGVSVQRLSLAERGLMTLDPPEFYSVKNLLTERFEDFVRHREFNGKGQDLCLRH